MEIEVGEFVRTNDGLIGKLIRIERDDIDTSLKWYVFYDNKNERYINKPYIVNHGKNIIDLIEYGDVLKIKEDNSIAYLGLTKSETTIILEDIIESIKEGKIELLEILTKEQFNQNCYRIEG